MARPDLSDPAAKAAYHAELRKVAVPWRFTGLGLVLAAAVGMVFASARGYAPGDPLMIGALALLAAGWAVLAVAITIRTRYHQRRMREPT